MVVADVLEGIGFRRGQGLAVHNDGREVVTLIGNKTIGIVRTALGNVRLRRADTAARTCTRYQDELAEHERRTHRVRGRNIVEYIGTDWTNVLTIHKHRFDIIAVGRGDFDGDRLAVRHHRVGRGDQAALSCRRRHRKFVDGEQRRDGVVVADVLEGIGFRRGQGLAVHNDGREVVTLIGNKTIGIVRTALGNVRLRRADTAARTCTRYQDELAEHERRTHRMRSRNIVEYIGTDWTDVLTVHHHRFDVVAVGSGNCNGNRLAVRHHRVGRGDQAAIARLCRHRKFVDGKLGRDTVVGVYICKQIRLGYIGGDTVHNQFGNVITFIGNNGVPYRIATIHRGHIRRSDGSMLRGRQHHRGVFSSGKGGMQCMIVRNMLKGVGRHCAHIHTVREDGVNMVTIGGGDGDGDCFIIVSASLCRSDGTAVARRRRHHIRIDGKLDLDGMVGADTLKRVRISNLHGRTVHQQDTGMPARFRNERIGHAFAARHCRVTGMGNRTMLTRLCRNHKLVHGESGMQRVASGNMLKRIGSHGTRIHAVNEDRINVAAVRCSNFDSNILPVPRY